MDSLLLLVGFQDQPEGPRHHQWTDPKPRRPVPYRPDSGHDQPGPEPQTDVAIEDFLGFSGKNRAQDFFPNERSRTFLRPNEEYGQSHGRKQIADQFPGHGCSLCLVANPNTTNA